MNQNKVAKTNVPITRSVFTSSVCSDGNNSKRPRDERQTDEDIDCDMLGKIQQMFAASNLKIEAKIDASNAKLEDRITGVENMLFALKTERTSSINNLSAAVTEVRAEVKSTTERMDRFEKGNDLIISGIPYVINESLLESFHKLATTLGYNDMDRPLVDLKRLMKVPIPIGATPHIICQFACRNARNTFYSRYLRSRNLSLRHLGFDSDQRVFLNENLTQEAREIRTAAIKMKKQGLFKKVFTRDGIVFVQRTNGSSSEPINDVMQLGVQSNSTLSK